MNELFSHLRTQLRQVYSEGEARAVAFLLMEEAFGVSRTDIYADKVRQFSQDERERLDNMCKLLVEDQQPVQYVVGAEWFMGRRFRVTPDVLIPRPETEELVRWAAQCAAGKQGVQIVDAGTGSGCIAVSLALELPEAAVCAIDLSEGALTIAKENAQKLGAQVRFEKADMLQPWDFFKQKVDIIVSNPPYICQREAEEMEQNVLQHEPHTALFVPDDDPLLFYRAIARYASRALKPGGTLLFETNTAFAHDVALLSEEVGMERVEVRNDRYGKPREVGLKRVVN